MAERVGVASIFIPDTAAMHTINNTDTGCTDDLVDITLDGVNLVTQGLTIQAVQKGTLDGLTLITTG
jgi:hypothetical protein